MILGDWKTWTDGRAASAAGRGEMSMKIVCCIDGREHSAQAAAVAFDLAKKLSAKLTLYMANPILPGRGSALYLWSDEYVQKVLDETARRARWSGVADVRCKGQRVFIIADEIVTSADEQEADYIVIGTSGRPGFLKVLGGSVSREVIAKANCPVVVVGRIRGKQRRPGGGLRESIFFQEALSDVA